MNFITAFAAAMLGHFVGDYLFQSQWMAIRKSMKGAAGHVACTVHIALYTLAVALFTGWHPLFLLVVAVPHWVIDRWSLAVPILKLKNGFHPFKEVWKKAPQDADRYSDPPTSSYSDLPISKVLVEDIANNSDALQLNVWKVAFAAPVYIFNDNTLHWVCLWFTCKYFFHG